ncbi:MAG: hypothetical protein DIU78_004550 [Pseudomonadota bacterium]|nr:MAG: hypothetical protein DIU78_04890 [Pseudomonadota bacterium]
MRVRQRATVASHNLMYGERLAALLPLYRDLRDRAGLNLLCLQEDTLTRQGWLSERVAHALGAAYEVVPKAAAGVALVYDARALACRTASLVPLPRLESLSWFERVYIRGGKTRQKHALVAEFRARSSEARFGAVCFHLDTAGSNHHRQRQIQAIADALGACGLARRFVACGDTNAFALRGQLDALRRVLAPFSAHGAHDPGTTPTHYFARQEEPLLTHRACVLAGRLGIDLPRRYDVVCTNLPALARGQVTARGSDHDLLWARLALDAEIGNSRRSSADERALEPA